LSAFVHFKHISKAQSTLLSMFRSISDHTDREPPGALSLFFSFFVLFCYMFWYECYARGDNAPL